MASLLFVSWRRESESEREKVKEREGGGEREIHRRQRR